MNLGGKNHLGSVLFGTMLCYPFIGVETSCGFVGVTISELYLKSKTTIDGFTETLWQESRLLLTA